MQGVRNAVKRFTFAALLLIGFMLPAWAENAVGLSAYEREDFATAFREFKKAAEQGDAAWAAGAEPRPCGKISEGGVPAVNEHISRILSTDDCRDYHTLCGLGREVLGAVDGGVDPSVQ